MGQDPGQGQSRGFPEDQGLLFKVGSYPSSRAWDCFLFCCDMIDI